TRTSKQKPRLGRIELNVVEERGVIRRAADKRRTEIANWLSRCARRSRATQIGYVEHPCKGQFAPEIAASEYKRAGSPRRRRRPVRSGEIERQLDRIAPGPNRARLDRTIHGGLVGPIHD